MSLLQQLIDYLSQPPDSIVYHIVTLLALQATLGLAWWQVRRANADEFARRLVWAAGVILLSRVLILLVYFATSGLVEAIALLPPLESAVNALTVATLVWVLAPRSRSLPNLGSALLVIVAIVIVFLYIAFAGEWRTLVDTGATNGGYAGTLQATVWTILQLSLLLIGGALVIYARESQWSLRLALLTIPLLALAASWLFGDSYGPPNVEISVWNRLGYLIVFPSLAILAYRHNMQNLMPAGHQGHSAVERLIQSLDRSREVSASLQPKHSLEDALFMALALMPARMVAIIQVNQQRNEQLEIAALDAAADRLSAPRPQGLRRWLMRKDHWPTLSAMLRNGQQVELLPAGSGARQHHELSQELKLDKIGSILIQPMLVEEREVGLLLLVSKGVAAPWPEEEKAIAKALGTFLAQALDNAQRHQLAMAGQAPTYEHELALLKSDNARITSERDQALERVAQLVDQLSVARQRMDTDDQKLRETTQALALAVQRQTKVRQLEEELTGLREALSEAELALAYAAAGEAGLSTDWVMRTVTRYSGELEEAQAQISTLEGRLKQPDGRDMAEHVAHITGRLRTPLTALGGYTDLLLERAAGGVSAQQESLLRRMRVNVDNMAATIDALATTSRSVPSFQTGHIMVNPHEALEEAIYAISGELQAKRIRVDVTVEDNLPALEDPGNTLNELLVSALSAACLVSSKDGRLDVSAARIAVETSSGGGRTGSAGFLRVSVSDDGGARSQSLYAGSIAKQGMMHPESSSGEATELAQFLESTAQIASSNGGRSWLDLSRAKGSTLILLIPLPTVATQAKN